MPEHGLGFFMGNVLLSGFVINISLPKNLYGIMAWEFLEPGEVGEVCEVCWNINCFYAGFILPKGA